MRTQQTLPRVRRTGRRGGFTLVEAVVGTVLVSLVFLGTMQLFIESQRGAQRTGVQVQASRDAAIGLQFALSNAREAWKYALPDGTGPAAFLPPSGVVGDYKSATGLNTALELVMPATTGYTLRDASGAKFSYAAPGGYDRTVQAGGDLLWLYRGDADKTPDGTAGQFLWSRRRPAGAADATRDTFQAVCKFILTGHADGTAAADAVQFRPSLDSSGAVIPNEVDVKIISGGASVINGTQTNEAADGSSVNALYGKCALMRNHG